MQLGEERYLALKNALFMHQLKVNLDREALKMVESQLQTRGGAVWQLVGLITRRS